MCPFCTQSTGTATTLETKLLVDPDTVSGLQAAVDRFPLLLQSKYDDIKIGGLVRQ